MKINIVSKQIPVTNAMRTYAEKKMTRITKYFDVPVDVTITFSVQKNIQMVEVLVHVKGLYLKGLEKSEDIYASLDLAIDKIDRQIVRYKDRINNRKYDSNNSFLRMNVYNVSSVEASAPEIIVSKEIAAKPMAVEEAAMQMDLLNKSFFVFRSASSGEVNVVYKRDDGNIGLIEP